jgi:hypothetical protein
VIIKRAGVALALDAGLQSFPSVPTAKEQILAPPENHAEAKKSLLKSRTKRQSSPLPAEEPRGRALLEPMMITVYSPKKFLQWFSISSTPTVDPVEEEEDDMKSTKLALWLAAFATSWAISAPCLTLHPSRTESNRKSALRLGRMEFSLRGGGGGIGRSVQGSSGQGSTNSSGDSTTFAPSAQFAAVHAAEGVNPMFRFFADTNNTNTKTTTISNSSEAG